MSANAWRSMLILSLVGLCMWACAFYALAEPVTNGVRVFFYRPDVAESTCAMLMNGERGHIACSNPAGFIIAPDPCRYSGRYADIICHEMRCHVSAPDGDVNHERCRA